MGVMTMIQYRNNTNQEGEHKDWRPVPRGGAAGAEPRVRIVGCGRWSMGDDQAGLVAADMLRRRCPLPYGRGSDAHPLPYGRGSDADQLTYARHAASSVARQADLSTPKNVEGGTDGRVVAATVTLSEQPLLDLTDDRIGPVDLLVVIDTALADEHHPAGSFQRIDYRHGARIRQEPVGIDTHSLGVASALQLADNLELLPEHVWIYVLFGRAFGRDLWMSGAVEAAIPALVELIEVDVTKWIRSRPCTSLP
jgi:Ni,Fe-hydrogenase maturation factor